MGASKSKQQKNHEEIKQHRVENTNEKDHAILQLKNSRDKIKKHIKKLEEEVKSIHILAKKLYNDNKHQSAKIALKRKIMKEKLIHDSENGYLLIVKMIDTVEWESINVQLFEALQTGNNLLEQFRQEMPIDKIEEILEGVNESSDRNEEINFMINGNNNNVLEDEELLKALDNLLQNDQEIKDNIINNNMNIINLPSVPQYPILPTIPTTEININDNTYELQQELL
jgi:hypothetical protein